MKKFYVIGSKASTSLSPTIFNYWFKKYKINAKYGFIETNKENFDIKIKKLLKEKNLSGLNITIPFKKTIMKHINVLDTHSKKINAVNCLVIKSKITLLLRCGLSILIIFFGLSPGFQNLFSGSIPVSYLQLITLQKAFFEFSASSKENT